MVEFNEDVFRESIRILRERKGLSQEKFADAIAVGRNRVSNYETGRTVPDISVLVRICQVLECDLETLVFGIVNAAIKENDFNIKYKTTVDKLFLCEKEKLLMKEFLNSLDLKNLELNDELEKTKTELAELKAKNKSKK